VQARGKRRVGVLHDDGARGAARAVGKALGVLGFEPVAVAVADDLERAIGSLREAQVELVVNLAGRLAENPLLAPDVAAALELARLPYTGPGPAGLHLAHDRALARRLMDARGISIADGPPTRTIAVLGNEQPELLALDGGPADQHLGLIASVQGALRLRDFAVVELRGAAVVSVAACPSLDTEGVLARAALEAGLDYESLIRRITRLVQSRAEQSLSLPS
jgi:hypothetical protein